MGSLRPRNSIRVRKSRSVKSIAERRRSSGRSEVQDARGRHRHRGRRATTKEMEKGKPDKDAGTASIRDPRKRHSKVPDSVPVPIAIELAIYRQGDTLKSTMTFLFSLHCVLRRQLEQDTTEVNEAVEDAAGWTDVTELTSMLLVRLHGVIRNLDNIARGEPIDVDPEDIAMTEAARTLSHVGAK
jgi:hypothetical protein